jgi:hypothetical protein
MLDTQPGAIVAKLFADVIYKRENKVECSSLASFYNLTQCLQLRPEPRRVELPSGAGSWPHPQTLHYKAGKACH